MGRVSGWTLSNSYSLKPPPSSTIGNFTLRTHCQSSKMPTAHLFLYLVDFGTALSTKSSSSSILYGKRNLSSAMAKTICKSLQVHNAFGIQIWCNYSDIDYTTYVDLTGPTRTRRNHDFKIRPRAARTNYFKFSFFNRYVNDWNSLPNSVMSASSLNSFKTLLLNYLCK